MSSVQFAAILSQMALQSLCRLFMGTEKCHTVPLHTGRPACCQRDEASTLHASQGDFDICLLDFALWELANVHECILFMHDLVQ